MEDRYSFNFFAHLFFFSVITPHRVNTAVHLRIQDQFIFSHTAACPLAKLVWRWRSRTDAAQRARLQEGADGTSEMHTKHSGMSISTLGVYSYTWCVNFPEIGGTRSHTHMAPARFARCAHMTQAVHCARKANTMNNEAPVNKLTSSNK